MAWRPYENLIEGELDNSAWAGSQARSASWALDEPVRFDLKGDFLADIKGKIIRLQKRQVRRTGMVPSTGQAPT